jgi:hypothetical protein
VVFPLPRKRVRTEIGSEFGGKDGAGRCMIASIPSYVRVVVSHAGTAPPPHWLLLLEKEEIASTSRRGTQPNGSPIPHMAGSGTGQDPADGTKPRMA